MGNKGSQTTTTSTAPNPQAGAAYSQLLAQAQTVGTTPYNPYQGELTAPVNQQQGVGIGNINQYAMEAQPMIQQAAQYTMNAAQPITQQEIQNYQSPYTQDVINATMANFANSNAQQQQQVLGNSVAQGALGGDRTAVAQSVLAGQQQAQEAPIIAGLENTGYGQAVNLAMQQYQQNPEAAAYSLANTGVAGENAALTGANAQVGAGTLQQQTQQAQDTAAYQQFLQQQAYPYQQLAFQAGIDTGVGSEMGGTSTTTGPPPSQLAQDIGIGASSLGSLGSLFSSTAGGTSAATGFGNFLASLGPAAAVAKRGGRVKGLATGGNAAYPLFGGGYGMPTTPYTGGPSWIPGMGITRGPGPPRPPQLPNQNQNGLQSAQQMFKNAAGLANSVGSNNSITPGQAGTAPEAWSPAGGDSSDTAIYARGGGVPVRAGLGLPSFLRRARGGFADGGSPYDQEYFDQAFKPDQGFVGHQYDVATNAPAAQVYAARAATDSTPSQLALTAPNFGAGVAYGQTNPYVPTPTARPAAADQEEAQAATPPPIGGAPQGVGGGPMAYAPPQGGGTAGLAMPENITPIANPPTPESIQPQSKGFLGLSPDFYTSLMAAGAGMLASRSPYAGVGIGEGIEAGLSEYGALQRQHLEQGKTQFDMDAKVRELDQAAKAESDKMSLATKPYEQMTMAEKATQGEKEQELGIERERLAQDLWSPFTDMLGKPMLLNKKTGEVRSAITPALPGNTAVPGTSPAQGIDPKTGRNEGYLTSLPTEEQSLVKGIADYNIDPSRVGYKQKTGMQAAVANYDPTYRSDLYPVILQNEQAFSKGKQGDQVRFFNNAIQHMATLQQYATAMQNGDVRALNSLKNTIQTQLGVAAPNTYDGLKDIVGQEIVKSIVPGAGGEAERQAVAQKLAQASSPQQLSQMLDGYTDLGAAQLRDLKIQYENGTYHKRQDFDDKLTPESKAALNKYATRLNASPAAVPGAAPVPGAKLYQGKWYTRGPNGESVLVQ